MLPPNTRYEYDSVVESGAGLATWKYVSFDPPADVRVQELLVDLPLKEDWPTSEEIQRQVQTCQDRVQAERLRRKGVVRSWLGEADVFSMPVWVWKLGDTILIGHHTETYSQLQTDLRARFPGQALVVMNLVNGTVGYQPPRNLYSEEVYQVWQTPLAEGSLETLIRLTIPLSRHP
jgi:hypothetical protein